MKNQTCLRVYVDFNSRDDDNNVLIHVHGSDDEQLNDKLTEGCSVILFDETLQVNALAKWNGTIQMWVGIPDWKAIDDLI